MKTLPILLTSILLMGNCFAVPFPAWTGYPMRPGIAAVTCTSSGDQTATGLNEHVLVFLDVRDPSGCGATPLPGAWSLGLPRMFFPSNNAWSVGNLGEVFGVDVGTGSSSHVYVAAAGPKPCNWGGSNIWNNRPYNTSALNTGGGGEVWRVDGTTHATLLLASLPNHKGYFQGAPLGGGAFTCVNGNSFVGLGQVSVNTKPGINKVYVSNMDDGKIYTLTDGVFNSTYPCTPFDHGATKPVAYGSTLADDPTSLYTQKSRLVFGLEYHPQLNRLFYALRNPLNQDEVWSIGLDANGCPTGQQCLEFVSPAWTGPAVGNFPGSSVAPSLPGDIQFSDDGCRMLVTQVSIRYEFINATSITGTPTFTGPVSQLIPMHYAHSSVGYEAKINNNPGCNPSFTRWTYIDRYIVGGNNYSPYTNSVAGDYGYGSIIRPQAVDSVVFVADVIRPLFPTYNFGLQIQPVGDFLRANTPANFDAPLLSGNPIVQATKIQLNDVDILHKDACMKIVTSPVTCPVGAGGQHKVTINITNTSSVPYFGISLTNCAPNPVMPGATPITPVFQTPPNINNGNPLNPGNSTGPLVVCLPGIPPAGGIYCFCVQMMSEVEGLALCSQMVCVTAPVCTPPCATIVAQDVVCDHVNGNFIFNLCVSNLQAQPITSIKFAPCPGSGGGPGGPVPTPNPYILTNPMPNGGSGCFPFVLPAPFTSGGQYCFEVTLCGGPPNDPHPIILCKKKVCMELPPCEGPCMELTPMNVTCPNVTGGAYTLNLLIKNLTATPATQVVFSMCSPPLPGCTPVLPSVPSITLGSPLLPNTTTIVPVSLPGLPCTGIKACFCVTLFNQTPPSPTQPEGPIIVLCKDSVCVQLPVCPCPPCMSLTPGTVLCPTVAGSPYTFTFTIKNLQAVPMAFFGVSQCAVPAGSSPVQPTPPGPSLIPGGPLAQNATSLPITVSLPVPLTGGSYCFCVTTFAANQQTVLCSERICVNLPSCRCGEINPAVDAVCNPGTGLTQVTFTVTNFTNLYASPYNFDLATFTPSLGFSSVVVTPNPIVPGATGTVTATYSGPPGNTCVTIVMSNATRTRCCTLKACFNNPECVPVPTHPDACKMPPEFICDQGVANLLVYICNNSVFARGYNWTITPTTYPGCTGNLPPGAFSPSSGSTATIGAFSSVGVACTVNTASLLPGQCAGFLFCFTPRGAAPGTPPICCKGKIVCGRPVDPCVGIGNPTTVIAPGKTIGIPIIIKNPTTAVLNASLVPSDMDGLLTFSRNGSVARTSDGEDNPDIITDEAPYSISLLPGETYQTTFFATYANIIPKTGPGIIVIGPPCVGRNVDDHYYDGRHLIYGPSLTTPDVPVNEALGDISPLDAPGHLGMKLPFKAQQGLAYHIRASQTTDFTELAAYLLTPVGEGLVVQPDGSFFSPAGPCDMGILRSPMLPREFYSISSEAIQVPFISVINNDR